MIPHGEAWSARIPVAREDGRPFRLAVSTEAEAHVRTELLAALAVRLRGHAAVEELAELLTSAAGARSAKTLAAAQEAADAIIAGETSKTSAAVAPTFEAFAKEWTSGDLRAKHPDHVREKDSSRDEQVLRDYINPQIGPTRLPDVTLERAERVMAKLPAALAPRTRKASRATIVLGLDLTEGSRWLRGRDGDPTRPGDLRRAGIARPELFERTAARQPIRLHDLRATFVTVSLANGRTEAWVTDRTGHKSSQMIATYARQARSWSELGNRPGMDASRRRPRHGTILAGGARWDMHEDESSGSR